MGGTPDTVGGTRGWKTGNLRRYLEAVSIMRFVPFAEGAQNAFSVTLQIKGLSPLLVTQVVFALMADEGSKLGAYPANPGTVQAFPWIRAPNAGGFIYGKPTTIAPVKLPHIFSFGPGTLPGGDPTMVDTATNGAPSYDGCDFVLSFDPAQYIGVIAPNFASLVVAGMADYVGAWWDGSLIENLFGNLSLGPARVYLGDSQG